MGRRRTGGVSFFSSFRSCLDLRLPGISGNDLCREIKKEAPSLPVIVLSAKTDIATRSFIGTCAMTTVTKLSVRENYGTRARGREAYRPHGSYDVFGLRKLSVTSQRSS